MNLNNTVIACVSASCEAILPRSWRAVYQTWRTDDPGNKYYPYSTVSALRSGGAFGVAHSELTVMWGNLQTVHVPLERNVQPEGSTPNCADMFPCTSKNATLGRSIGLLIPR